MVNAGLIVIAFVCAGVAGWNVARKQYFKKKFKDLQVEYDKVCEQHENTLGEVVRTKLDYEKVLAVNANLNTELNDYKHLNVSGCRNMKVLERTLPMIANIPQGCVVVAGVDTCRSGLYFPIKTFFYDINDPSDREFAIREAEELIETIQKA